MPLGSRRDPRSLAVGETYGPLCPIIPPTPEGSNVLRKVPLVDMNAGLDEQPSVLFFERDPSMVVFLLF